MWNNGQHIEWGHICKLVNDQFMTTKGAPKLTQNHINLNSYSVMNVRLAVQTLSATVAAVLRNNYPQANATADFCDMGNKFFDVMNIRCQKECLKSYYTQRSQVIIVIMLMLHRCTRGEEVN